MDDVGNLRIVLTGATSGLGRALAKKLVQAGASIALCGRSAEKLELLKKEIGAASADRVIYEAFDAADTSRIVAFVTRAGRAFDKIDVLINCAGLNSARSPVESIAMEDFDWMLMVNARAPLVFMQECYRSMKVNKQGLIVNILSTACLSSNEGLGAYTASKAACEGLTKVFRKEARNYNVRVCAVYPGGIDTPFRANQRPDYMSPEAAADVIIPLLTVDPAIAPDEIVFRPLSENNF